MYITIDKGSIKDFIIKLKDNKDNIKKFKYVNEIEVFKTVKQFLNNSDMQIIDFTQKFYTINGGLKK